MGGSPVAARAHNIARGSAGVNCRREVSGRCGEARPPDLPFEARPLQVDAEGSRASNYAGRRRTRYVTRKVPVG